MTGWELRARSRLRDRIEGRVVGLPLSAGDRDAYERLIASRVARGEGGAITGSAEKMVGGGPSRVPPQNSEGGVFVNIRGGGPEEIGYRG
jgi:hypothetical protein